MSVVNNICPGGCTRRCPAHDCSSTACRFTCNLCWERLPLDLRRRLLLSHSERIQVEHILLMGDAKNWFLRHPLKKPVKQEDDWLTEAAS